jgi:hypothetical protein
VNLVVFLLVGEKQHLPRLIDYGVERSRLNSVLRQMLAASCGAVVVLPTALSPERDSDHCTEKLVAHDPAELPRFLAFPIARGPRH